MWKIPSAQSAHPPAVGSQHEATLFPPVCQSGCQTRARGCAPAAPSFRKSRPTDSTSRSHSEISRVGQNNPEVRTVFTKDEFYKR